MKQMMRMVQMVQMKTWCGVRAENSGYKAVPGVARDRSEQNGRFRERPISSNHLRRAPKLRSAFKSYVHLTLQTTVFRVRPTYLGISMWRFSRRGVLPLLSPNLFHVSHFVLFSLLDLVPCLEEFKKSHLVVLFRSFPFLLPCQLGQKLFTL